MNENENFPNNSQPKQPRRCRPARNQEAINNKWRARRHLSHARPQSPSRGTALGEGAALAAYVGWLVLMLLWLAQNSA